jgi:hypothetical protein
MLCIYKKGEKKSKGKVCPRIGHEDPDGEDGE